jgi:hypothetical protein
LPAAQLTLPEVPGNRHPAATAAEVTAWSHIGLDGLAAVEQTLLWRSEEQSVSTMAERWGKIVRS